MRFFVSRCCTANITCVSLYKFPEATGARQTLYRGSDGDYLVRQLVLVVELSNDPKQGQENVGGPLAHSTGNLAGLRRADSLEENNRGRVNEERQMHCLFLRCAMRVFSCRFKKGSLTSRKASSYPDDGESGDSQRVECLPPPTAKKTLGMRPPEAATTIAFGRLNLFVC